jgi:hypothetical protein
MTRLLKPVPSKAVKYLSQICAQYFREIKGYRIIEHSLGNNFTGRIDLLATDDSRVYLVTIGTSDFPHALFRSLMGYRWFSENREFLKRIYSPEEIDITKPVSLVILSQDFPSGSCDMCEQACLVPISLYRYRLFGTGDDPDISIESISDSGEGSVRPEEDMDILRKNLGIEEAHLSDQEIRDFRAAIGL